jgi:hypothetical protein
MPFSGPAVSQPSPRDGGHPAAVVTIHARIIASSRQAS